MRKDRVVDAGEDVMSRGQILTGITFIYIIPLYVMCLAQCSAEGETDTNT